MPKLATRVKKEDFRKIRKVGLTAIGYEVGLNIRFSLPNLHSFVYRYSFYGTKRTITIGSIDCITLQEARAIVNKYRAMIYNFKDPYLYINRNKQKLIRYEIESKRVNRTFKEVSLEWKNIKRIMDHLTIMKEEKKSSMEF